MPEILESYNYFQFIEVDTNAHILRGWCYLLHLPCNQNLEEESMHSTLFLIGVTTAQRQQQQRESHINTSNGRRLGLTHGIKSGLALAFSFKNPWLVEQITLKRVNFRVFEASLFLDKRNSAFPTTPRDWSIIFAGATQFWEDVMDVLRGGKRGSVILSGVEETE